MTKFNGLTEKTITFLSGGGEDISTTISIEKRSAIFNATMNVTGKLLIS